MSTSILKLEATVIRPKDFDELDGLAASISFPVEYDDEAIGEALGDQDLMAYVVGELHDLVVRMRPEWLDNEDTMFPNIKIVEAIRKEYPAGTRVRLVKMDDIQAPPLGTEGTVVGVDDTGNLLMHWDNGSHLNIVYGSDEVEKV